MKKLTCLFAAIALLCVGLAYDSQDVAAASGVKWFDSYAKALKESKDSGKPLLVEFR